MAAGAVRDRAAASRFLFLTTVGNHGLLPLLFGPAEYPIKARAAREAQVHCCFFHNMSSQIRARIGNNPPSCRYVEQ